MSRGIDSQSGGIDTLESTLGLLKCLQIRAYGGPVRQPYSYSVLKFQHLFSLANIFISENWGGGGAGTELLQKVWRNGPAASEAYLNTSHSLSLIIK